MKKISSHLWFDSQAEDAARFYTSLFKNSRIGTMTRYGKAGFEIHGQPEGKLMTIDFELDGQPFIGLNAGPVFTFTPAISFLVACSAKEDVDTFTVLERMLQDRDKAKVERVTNAFLKMKKFDLTALQRAYEGLAPAH